MHLMENSVPLCFALYFSPSASKPLEKITTDTEWTCLSIWLIAYSGDSGQGVGAKRRWWKN